MHDYALTPRDLPKNRQCIYHNFFPFVCQGYGGFPMEFYGEFQADHAEKQRDSDALEDSSDYMVSLELEKVKIETDILIDYDCETG